MVNTLTHLARGIAATLLLVFAVTSPALAQGGAGLTLGATASELHGDFITVRGDSKWGFYGGGFGEVAVGDVLALNLGVNYAQKGGSGLTGTGLLDTERIELELKYVELPLLVNSRCRSGRTGDSWPTAESRARSTRAARRPSEVDRRSRARTLRSVGPRQSGGFRWAAA